MRRKERLGRRGGKTIDRPTVKHMGQVATVDPEVELLLGNLASHIFRQDDPKVLLGFYALLEDGDHAG